MHTRARSSASCMAVGVVLVVAGFGAPAAAQVTFEWATVGNPGNAADPLNSGSIPGIGSVAYVYRIAKHEVTNDQYAAFLNAVAATDTNGLYNVNMGSDARGGITRSGSSGSFTYAVQANMGNKPVNYVSFFDAMRFVNWLHNGQPTGAQNASTTEDGVYAIGDGVSETRAVFAQFFIPTDNEWYKAAYHQPALQGGDADDYWLYATASNGVPTPATANATGDISNPGTNVVNYNQDAVWNGQTGNVTTVGSAGALSASFYGTSDQTGNLWEWTEALSDPESRRLRGGCWADTELFLLEAGGSWSFLPSDDNILVGLRVASPDPMAECAPGQYNNAGMSNEYSLVGCIPPTTCPPCTAHPIFGCQECAIDSFPTEFGPTPVAYSDWYLYSPTCTGTLVIDTCETPGDLSTYVDTVLGLYANVGTQTQGDVGLLASNDEGCDPVNHVEHGGIIVWDVQFGEAYGVRIAGYGDQGGGDGLYALRFTCNPAESVSVPAGGGVTATIGGGAGSVGGVSMTFENVDQSGDLSADFAEVPPDYEPLVNVNFQLPSDPTQVWNIAFDGTFTGTVELVFTYVETALLVPEGDLQVYHFDGALWSALTKVNQDLTGNTITVETTSFSLFALGAAAGPVPALGNFALVVFGGLLLAAGAYVMRGRPRAFAGPATIGKGGK